MTKIIKEMIKKKAGHMKIKNRKKLPGEGNK